MTHPTSSNLAPGSEAAGTEARGANASGTAGTPGADGAAVLGSTAASGENGGIRPASADESTAGEVHAVQTPGKEPQDVATTEQTPSGAVAAKPFGTGSLFDRFDLFMSRLSSRSHFWQRVCSFIWMPYTFKSGIRVKRVDERTFSAVLPFRRFNRNWYNAMAGAALLANSEIAGGMYIFGICGGEYTVVCKHLEYKFLRPCFGPAVYKINPKDDIHAMVATGKEFNITLELDIVQQSMLPRSVRPTAERVLPKSVGSRVAGKEKRVGKAVATFHVTPKSHQQSKGRAIR